MFQTFMASETLRRESFLLLLLIVRLASADFLQNPDFESPPLNLPKNSTSSSIVPLGENSTIPGWTFQGSVQYVKANQTVKLPDNGHAIQLGQDGKINQTFAAKGDNGMNYILTFSLVHGGQNCSSNADLVVSAPDSRGVFSYKQNYGKRTWQSYGHYLGLFGDGEPVNLIFESQTADSDSNSTCWPIIDSLLVKTVATTLIRGNDNLLQNGGFEYGPDFLRDSSEGILVEAEPSPVQSALRQWSVVGAVRYINSKNFHVPEGKAAIEILSGSSSGIETATDSITQGSRYNLTFALGDANDGCKGDFLVGVRAGSTIQNFTVRSQGTGSDRKFSLAFEAGRQATVIGFLSYASSHTEDGVLCGPVVDDVILRASHGIKSRKVKLLHLLITTPFFVLIL